MGSIMDSESGLADLRKSMAGFFGGFGISLSEILYYLFKYFYLFNYSGFELLLVLAFPFLPKAVRGCLYIR